MNPDRNATTEPLLTVVVLKGYAGFGRYYDSDTLVELPAEQARATVAHGVALWPDERKP